MRRLNWATLMAWCSRRWWPLTAVDIRKLLKTASSSPQKFAFVWFALLEAKQKIKKTKSGFVSIEKSSRNSVLPNRWGESNAEIKIKLPRIERTVWWGSKSDQPARKRQIARHVRWLADDAPHRDENKTSKSLRIELCKHFVRSIAELITAKIKNAFYSTRNGRG